MKLFLEREEKKTYFSENQQILSGIDEKKEKTGMKKSRNLEVFSCQE